MAPAAASLRIDVSATVNAGDHLALLGEVRTENFGNVQPYALYLRIRPWTTRDVDVEIGRVPPTFGAFPRRSYGSKLAPVVEEDPREAALAALLGNDPPVSVRASVGFAISPDGKLLAFANYDGTIPVVDVLTGTTRQSMRRSRSARISAAVPW